MNNVYNENNPFDFRSFYNGSYEAWGVATDVFGNARRRYRIDGQAELDGEQAHLTEKYTYNNGKSYERQWTINYDSMGGLTGIGTDIEELIVGTLSSDRMYLDYTFNVQGKKTKIKHIRTEHWQYPIDESHVMHLVKFKKYGIPLVRASAVFIKVT